MVRVYNYRLISHNLHPSYTQAHFQNLPSFCTQKKRIDYNCRRVKIAKVLIISIVAHNSFSKQGLTFLTQM